MKQPNYSVQSLWYYSRFYRMQCIAVIIAVAVIVGSLLVGDSVRHTLTKRVTERLLDTETVLFSRSSFMESSFSKNPIFNGSAKGYLLTNGFVSQNGRLIPVDVWGVDEPWLSRGKAQFNANLANELGNTLLENGDIVLRLPAIGLVPSGALFVSENYTTSIRLVSDGVLSPEEGGNLSLRNEHALPLNIFVNQQELGELLELTDKVNLIFSKNEISSSQLKQTWNYNVSGLQVIDFNGYKEISSNRVFMQQEVVDRIVKSNPTANRLFSYLANSIKPLPSVENQKTERAIPYSFVTAADRYDEEALQSGEVILSDYSANRLSVKEGDSVAISYFVSDDFKSLQTESLHLRVKRIVPLEELHADKRLSADFPGLTSVESCTQWDSDLPIDMNLITDEDERYWEHYRATPKAILSYADVAKTWSNAYGSATAIRITDKEAHLSELTPEMFGVQSISPRGDGFYSAMNGVNFASLFLALGFFIIVAAFLFMTIPFSEMCLQRRKEFDLLRALGFSQSKIAAMLRVESEPLTFFSSLLGVVVGIIYTFIILWLLEDVWKGATHTNGFSIYFRLLSIFAGWLIGCFLSLFILRRTIVRNIKVREQEKQDQQVNLKKKKKWMYVMGWITLCVTLINLLMTQSVIFFVIASILFLAFATLFGDYLLCKKGMQKSDNFTVHNIIWSTLYANRKQAILSFLTLALGVFTVFSVGLNRQGFADSSQLKSGTGGYTLWCESSVPIYHNLTTKEGRERMSLFDLPSNVTFLQCLRYSSDEASCLNLNKVISPTVLGVDIEALRSSDFQMDQALTATNREALFIEMQYSKGKIYPALVDATVLTWSLGLKLGDYINYTNDKGEHIAIQLVGTIKNSIFQGQILIDRSNFISIWPETTGSNVFLAKIDEAEREQVGMLLSQALSEYGVRITTTNQRLSDFYSVTDTYLTIFMTLGGLGLLLGIFCFVIIIRKNLAMRDSEITLLSTIGFSNNRISRIFIKESLIVPLYAVLIGVAASFLGISGGVQNVSIWIYLLALLFTILFIGILTLFTCQSVKNTIHRISSNNINSKNSSL